MSDRIDHRMAERREQFEAEDKERIENIRRYIGVGLLPQDRDNIVKQFDELVARYRLFAYPEGR